MPTLVRFANGRCVHGSEVVRRDVWSLDGRIAQPDLLYGAAASSSLPTDDSRGAAPGGFRQADIDAIVAAKKRSAGAH